MTESVIKEIENRIKSNSFNSKEELVNYLNSLRQNNQIDINLLNERYMSLLKLYDDTMTASDSLNISNYKDASLEDKNFIVSSNDGRVLESNSNTPLKEEFESVQNEMAVNGENGIANADQVFNYMEKYKKTEASLMPLSNLNILTPTVIKRETKELLLKPPLAQKRIILSYFLSSSEIF